MESEGFFKNKLWPFVKKHKWSIILIFLLICLLSFFLWDILSAKDSTVNPLIQKVAKKEEPKLELFKAPLSGRMVEESITKKQPISVVIENHPDSRPQSGLNEAALIYETYAEGGITRFLAFFQDQEPKEIGPVRSAREYFVEWANSYKAPFAHVGGSAEALDLIKKMKIYDLNQFYFGKYFWRDKSRYSPHNVYTTIEKLRSASSQKNYPLENYNIPAFIFKKDIAKEERPQSTKFKVNFNGSYAVTWEYDPTTNSYNRMMLGAYQTDRITKKKVVAKNVIVVFTDMGFGVSTQSGKPRSEIRTTGSGKSYFFIDGAKTEGTWKRSSDNQVMRFYDISGKELKLNAGTTWVEVVQLGTQIN